MRRNGLLWVLLTPLFCISCESPSATLTKYATAGAEAQGVQSRNTPFEVQEVSGTPGVSIIVWSVSVTNVFNLSRLYTVKVEFNDAKGAPLFTDIVNVLLGPGETKKADSKIEVPTEKAVKVMGYSVSYGG